MKNIKIYFETYGCQMNLNDTEIAGGILRDSGIQTIDSIDDADVIVLNTCAVRDNAEQTILHRLDALKFYKKKKSKLIIGVIGCMAERLGEDLIEKKQLVDFVVGPDEYRKLPEIIEDAAKKIKSTALELSLEETYSDIIPERNPTISAWISIMRGCNNFCTYCVVPYTRGRERSKPFDAVMSEMDLLVGQGAKEVTLLGQNVNSYNDEATGNRFPELLEAVAVAHPKIRIRFVTSHPYDLSDKMIDVIAKYDNICNYIHLPVQAGSDRMLKLMNRKYTKAHYLGIIERIRKAIPDCALSTDTISGFCSETEEDHKELLELMKNVRYDSAFMFNYSTRPGTKAHKSMEDDVDMETKRRRLNEVIEQQNRISKEKNEAEIGKIHEIMVESRSKKNPDEWQGRSGTNKVIIFDNSEGKYKAGDLVHLEVYKASSATLFGKVVG
jgi:tRNA-2-methylthio-N6-dimethylallyladenosine synthase